MLLTRLPLGIATPFDLHVLGTPPALVLSQDQTLHKKSYGAFDRLPKLRFCSATGAELDQRFAILYLLTKSRDSKDIA